jgi:hypothetical protein
VPRDAEQALLEHLAHLKRAVGEGVGAAPDLGALRKVIGDMFASVQFVRLGEVPSCEVPVTDDVVPVSTDYWMLLVLRASAVDRETLRPIGQAMPVPTWQSYPPGFLARYCWW